MAFRQPQHRKKKHSLFSFQLFLIVVNRALLFITGENSNHYFGKLGKSNFSVFLYCIRSFYFVNWNFMFKIWWKLGLFRAIFCSHTCLEKCIEFAKWDHLTDAAYSINFSEFYIHLYPNKWILFSACATAFSRTNFMG